MHRSGCYEQQVKNTPPKTLHRVVIMNIYSILSLNQHLFSCKLKQNSEILKTCKMSLDVQFNSPDAKKKQVGGGMKTFLKLFSSLVTVVL